jgi:thimet oligopeptidase
MNNNSISIFNFLFIIIFFVFISSYIYMKTKKFSPYSYKYIINKKENVFFISDEIEKQVKKIVYEIESIKPNLFIDYKKLFQETYEKFNYLLIIISKINFISLYNSVGSDLELKIIINDILKKLEKLFIDKIYLNKDLYLVLKQTQEILVYNIDFKNNQKLMLDVLKDYKKEGIELSEEKILELKEIKLKLIELEIKFDENIRNTKNGIYVSKNLLDGLSEEFISNLKKDEKSDDLFLDVSYPTYDYVMRNCKDQTVRKSLYKAFNNRAYPKNIEVFKEIRNLEEKVAVLLGYKNYADYSLEDEMAKNVENVELFLNNIDKLTKMKALSEKSQIIEFSRAFFGDENKTTINPWDVSYIYDKYEKQYFNLDHEKIAEYFPVKHTIKKLLEIYSKFFNIKIEEIKYKDIDSWKWNENLTVLRVEDNNGNIFGDIILDLYPRENKFSHACCQPVISPVVDFEGSFIDFPITVMIANFNKPSNGHDGLLKHNEVITFFHEFGHCLHSLMSQSKYLIHSGILKMPRDFVEMPSQLFEQWIWESDILRMISYNYKDGSSLPEEIIYKLISSRSFGKALGCQRQNFLSKISLRFFTENTPIKTIIKEEFDKSVSISYLDQDNNFECSFGHLCGYGPAYYGYLWSKAYAIDIFYHINKYNGILDNKYGNELYKNILSKGSSIEYIDMIKDFLGRNTNLEAFEKYINS